MDDLELLRQFADEGSKEAFAELVRRHADLVYSAARRQLTDAHQAEDAVQAVFVLLTQKSHKVRGSLPGWLIQATYFICRNTNKLAARRRFHERGAALMRPEDSRAAPSQSEQPIWENYSNVIDEAMARLRPEDRDAVVLRYLRGMSLRDVGAALGVGEDAARKRVDRSVERLRKAVSAKTAVPAAAVLVMDLTAHGVQTAPVALVQSITGAVATGTLASSTLKAIIMSTKVKLAYTTGVVLAALFLGVGTVKLVKYIAVGGTPAAPPSEQIADNPPQSFSPASNPPLARRNGAQNWQGYPMRAPFNAVRWSGQTPQVQVAGAWYELTAIDSISIDQIISFDQSLPQGVGADYKKHFQEDLVELMSRMGHEPGATVALSVTDPVSGKDQVLQNVAMTEANRAAILAAAPKPPGALRSAAVARSGNAVNATANAAARAHASGIPDPLPLTIRPADTRTSPFMAVRWDGDTPQVQVNQIWYELVAFDGTPAGQIVDFAKQKYPGGPNSTFWQKRVSEDLVDVLTAMNHRPNNVVSLDLKELVTGQSVNMPAVAMTSANRDTILHANINSPAQGGTARGGAIQRGTISIGTPAPFTAVRWMDATPWIKVNGIWYELLAVDDIPIQKIVDAAKVKYPESTFVGWYKRQFLQLFGEVLQSAGDLAGDTVKLKMRTLDTKEEVTLPSAPMSVENQVKSMLYMRSSPFNAVRWVSDTPEVRVNDTWYEFVSMDGHSPSEVGASSAGSSFSDRETWMYSGWTPGDTVKLELKDLKTHDAVTLSDVVPTPLNLQLSGLYSCRMPFTGVRWHDATPEVQVNGTWFQLVSIDHQPAQSFGGPDNPRQLETLASTLAILKDPVEDTVNLELQTLDTKQSATLSDVPMKIENYYSVVGWVQDPKDSNPSGLQATPILGNLRWADGKVQAQLNDTWYELVAIDDNPVADIVTFAQNHFTGDWLHEQLQDRTDKVMTQFGHTLYRPPNYFVTLQLKTLDTGEVVKVFRRKPLFPKLPAN